MAQKLQHPQAFTSSKAMPLHMMVHNLFPHEERLMALQYPLPMVSETSRNALTDIEIFGTATTGEFFSEKYISDGVLGLETLDLTNDSAFSLYQFDEISFRPADLGRGSHYDNIGYTTSVPEPGTTALILGGTALLATGAGRQRAKTPKL